MKLNKNLYCYYFSIILILIHLPAWGQAFKLGLVSDGVLKANSEAAFKWV